MSSRCELTIRKDKYEKTILIGIREVSSSGEKSKIQVSVPLEKFAICLAGDKVLADVRHAIYGAIAK